jgi:hypothetical protein
VGFSLTGLVIDVAILAPTLLRLVFPPRDDIRHAPRRVGCSAASSSENLTL